MAFFPRSIGDKVRADLDRKIVLMSGPRQTGKTTLARSLYPSHDYLNFDSAPDRVLLHRREWNRQADVVVFDELHKKPRWKAWLKGIVDTEGVRPRLLVTGSARLDLARRVGDSLAGRFFHHRLHPFDLKEAAPSTRAEERSLLSTLLRCGGFPEPFLEGTDEHARRWRRGHLDIVLRQDLLDLERVRDITAIETLVQMMRERTGKPISHLNLARDLERDPKTIKRWLGILENLYVLFKVTPYSTKVARSLLKEPRYYFFDNGQIEGNNGERFENLVACALLKELHRIEDQEGRRTALHYLRTRDKREVDFLAVVDKRPTLLFLEAKWNEDKPSRSFEYFAKLFPRAARVWLVAEDVRERSTSDGTVIRSAPKYLASLEIPGH